MTDTPSSATLYSDGRTPLFLDLARITFDFAGGPPHTSEVRLADIDYEKGTATIVFFDNDRIATGAHGSSLRVHTNRLKFICRGPASPEDQQHPAEEVVSAISGTGKSGLSTGALIAERNRLAAAEAAINDYALYSRSEAFPYGSTVNPEGHSQQHFARLAGKARHTALNRLSRLSGAQALSVIEGNRIGDHDGSTFPFASLAEVQERRVHLGNMQGYHAAGERILRRLRARAAQRPGARMSWRNRRQFLPKGV
jgi:hypothetical protein